MAGWQSMGIARLLSAATVGLSFLIISCGGLSCYDCNSHYNKDCGDPFSNYTTELIDCKQEQHKMTHLPLKEDGNPYEANICRKTIQTINGKVRIRRSCGWLPNSDSMKDRDCFTRTGTHQVMVYHCVCKGDACNSASLFSAPLLVLFVSLILSMCTTL